MAEKVISIADSITVSELAETLNIPVTSLIGELFKKRYRCHYKPTIRF